MGFKDLKEAWLCFDKQHRALPEFIGNSKWQHVQPAVTMRNKLAHGERVYKLAECKLATEKVLDALNEFRAKLQAEIQFDGWSRLPVRKEPELQWLSLPTSFSSGLDKAELCASTKK